MRLAAIYCYWDDDELLKHSMENIIPLVDGVVVAFSLVSNYGDQSTPAAFLLRNDSQKPVDIIQVEPDLKLRPDINETNKRNAGLELAKQKGYTHFLMMDADEFYEPEPFLKEKERFLNENLNGLVCASQVYFKHPWLTIGLDTTLVTFIHKITPNLKFEFNRRFPFAFDGINIRIDPTRQLNIDSGVEWSQIIMHHYSYIRKDLEKKIRNSSARANLERSTIRQDFALAKEGEMCNFYGKKLFRATVDFGIPDVYKDLQPVETSSPEQ